MALTKLNAVVIGCGAISSVHTAAIDAVGANLKAVCDINPIKLNGKDNTYTDYIEMLDTVHPDVVHILTPHYLHAQMCIDALQRGIHVVVEKPPAMTQTQFIQLNQAVNQSSAQLAVCFQNRLNAGVKQALNLIKSGQLGNITGALGLVYWKRDNAYYQSESWRGTINEEGGGVLINQAIHTLDLITLLMGRPTVVNACAANLCHQGVIEVEDCITVSLDYQNSIRATLMGCTFASVSRPVLLEIYTQNGTLSIYPQMAVVDKAQQLTPFEYTGKKEWGDGHTALISEFYSDIVNHKPTRHSLKNAANTMDTMFAIYRSVQSGQPIKI